VAHVRAESASRKERAVKVVVAHNAYQHRGGEDSVMDSEVALLRRHGHEVIEYRRRNQEIAGMGRLRVAADTFWSRRTVVDLRELLRVERPQILHAHNTFPLISPSIYWTASESGVPVVQTLHNFRLLCPQAMLLREGRVCQRCLGRAPLPGVLHGCYRGSRAQSGVLAGMLMLHRGLGTWARKVDRYIALNEFCRAKFIEGGLPAERILVKPNFVDLPPPPSVTRRGLLFVGRLSPEKGVAVLADAARGFAPCSLRVAGAGPDEWRLGGLPAVEALGELASAQVADEMSSAVALVMPSIWYENFPRTLVEAFACGLPVLASRIGALTGIVEDGVTGLHVEPGNAQDLAAKMQWALAHPERMAEMGRAARVAFERHYTPEANYRQLMAIYEEAIAAHAERRAGTA
jgi:glycosyltransferase involved in cell wall biosynthesis